MTGIYIAAAVAVVWIAVTGRLRAARLPTSSMISVLAVFVVALAADGTNALLVDLGATHPYDPSNELRLITGILAGTTLGIAIGHLFAASMWLQPDRKTAVVTSQREVLCPIVISIALASLARTGLPILYAPFAVGLLVASVGVFSLLAMIALALMTDRGRSHNATEELAPLAVAGFTAAIVIIAGLSCLRFAVERFFVLPQLT